MNHKSIREKHESKKFLSETVVALKIFLENLGKNNNTFKDIFIKQLKFIQRIMKIHASWDIFSFNASLSQNVTDFINVCIIKSNQYVIFL